MISSRQTIQIQSTFPCSEDWNSMSPVQGGRNCSKCSKVVVDLRNLTDGQIHEVSQQHESEFCAAIRPDQLNRPIAQSKPRKSKFYLPPVLASFLAIAGAKTAQAQKKPDYSQVWYDKETPNCALIPEANKIDSISGIVVDAETQEPIPFMPVFIEGTLVGGLTDFDGNFKFNVPDSLNKSSYQLIATQIGYDSTKVQIDSSLKTVRVKLQANHSAFICGGIGVSTYTIPQETKSIHRLSPKRAYFRAKYYFFRLIGKY